MTQPSILRATSTTARARVAGTLPGTDGDARLTGTGVAA
jgi:hypothetical protein